MITQEERIINTLKVCIDSVNEEETLIIADLWRAIELLQTIKPRINKVIEVISSADDYDLITWSLEELRNIVKEMN